MRASCSMLAVLALLPGATLGQDQPANLPDQFQWDLSYQPLLKKNQIGDDDFLAKWLKQTKRSFPRDILKSWKGDPIVASVLIERAAFHAGEHQIDWFIRTEKQAFWWRAIDKHFLREPYRKEIDIKLLDQAMQTLAAWEQAKPAPENIPHDSFIGFISIYHGEKSRQLLLTVGDFYNGSADRRLTKLLQAITK